MQNKSPLGNYLSLTAGAVSCSLVRLMGVAVWGVAQHTTRSWDLNQQFYDHKSDPLLHYMLSTDFTFLKIKNSGVLPHKDIYSF